MKKVLVVDDDRTTVTLLQTLLELDGFGVIVCPRGSEVVNTMRAEKPDIVLMDYHLADMKGLEVLKQIRADDELGNTVVVMTSGLDASLESEAAGADTFLIKPFEPGKLAGLFNDLIAKRASA